MAFTQWASDIPLLGKSSCSRLRLLEVTWTQVFLSLFLGDCEGTEPLSKETETFVPECPMVDPMPLAWWHFCERYMVSWGDRRKRDWWRQSNYFIRYLDLLEREYIWAAPGNALGLFLVVLRVYSWLYSGLTSGNAQGILLILYSELMPGSTQILLLTVFKDYSCCT